MAEPVKVEPLSCNDWDARLKHIVNDMRGRPLNVHGLMAHNPPLLEAWWNFRNHAVNGGGLADRHRELVILRVARHLETWYEWASHVERGLRAGLTLAEIARVGSDADYRDWPPEDAIILRATDESLAHYRITAPTRVELEQLLDTAQIMDLVAICGMYVILGVMINTWGLELDESVELPDGVSEDGWLRP